MSITGIVKYPRVPTNNTPVRESPALYKNLGNRAPKPRFGLSARTLKPGQALGPTSPSKPKGRFRLGFGPRAISQGKTKKRKTITHGSSSEQCSQSVPVVRSVYEIMALLRHPKENTPPRRDPVELPLPMIESFLYSIISDYEDREYFNCMMSDM
ncbi:hypothetical protein Pyn_34536 [Prunus yedoensis var. nudiflora]|uniref:Uncharacterized protein n=1 Tax=Prunus yedoensis var. nudiflora TaxID=2094558 RepID=A0A314Y9K1_PRUYE|nr:hypothetical protein Pyn_34536 [Prunus yedoensis var. nudiflora]